MNEERSVKPPPTNGTAIALGTGGSAQSTPWGPPIIVLVIEAADEPAATAHFLAVQSGQCAPVFELCRGLLFAQAQASGRYWRFELVENAQH